MSHVRISLQVTVFVPLACTAQTQVFEVASIKPNKSGGESYLKPTVRGDLAARNVSLQALIQKAYDIKDWRIAGGPAWLASDKYDIEAKGPKLEGVTAFPELQQRMQALLAERFQLKVHHEQKELPMFALVIAKSSPKLTQASGANCYVVTPSKKPADFGRAATMRSLLGAKWRHDWVEGHHVPACDATRVHPPFRCP
jgi:uncharacterized protein (TIGR03435 family)